MAMDELLVLAEEFVTWELLKSQDKEFFESSNYEAACHDIGVIQSQREITKTMMNMKRISPFLTGMAHLEKVLAAIKFQHTIKVMAYVWGPVRYLLKVCLCSTLLCHTKGGYLVLTVCDVGHESHRKSI
jgi:UDP-N-acetylglucosamine:LPS N-acetylglucosamine transferase